MPRNLSAQEIENFRLSACAAAQKLFSKRGIEGVTMRAIATELGVSTMTTYYYFKDKNEILAAVLTEVFAAFMDAIDQAGEIEGTAYERAREKRRVYVQYALAHPEVYRLMFETPHPAEADHPEMSAVMMRARDSMRRTAEELIAAGMIKGDPELLGQVFWATIHGPVSLYFAGKLPPHIDLDAVIDTAILGLFYSLSVQLP